jgi:tetratricopeptide (TPR) repeat protein
MWASIVMLVGAVGLRGGLEAYHKYVMPPPAELGAWSDDETLPLPSPILAEDVVQAEMAAPSRYAASLQHDVSGIRKAEPEPAEGETRVDAATSQAEGAAGPRADDSAAEPATEAAGAAEPRDEAVAAEQPVEPKPAAGETTEVLPVEPAAGDQPESFEVQLALARQLLARAQPGQALPVFERAIGQRAHSVDALLGKAAALFALQDYEAAKSSAQQAVAIDPRSHDGLMLIGSSFERLGDRDAARNVYGRCVEEAVDLTSCRERLAELDAKR